MKDIVTDFSQFVGLKAEARNNDPAALRKAAEQFESLFLETMLKSMRKASIGDPIFKDSGKDSLYQQMFDQQLAREVAGGPGVGLADVLVRQLASPPVAGVAPSREKDIAIEQFQAKPRLEAAPTTAGQTTVPVAQPEKTAALDTVKAEPEWASPLEFARRMWPYATRVAARLGTIPQAIVAQAALETGWGQRMLRTAEGLSSNNFFGIKANRSWTGDSVSRSTVEYSDGEARREQAKFRSYPSAAAGFSDYLNFLESNGRYENVFGHGEDVEKFASSLQDAGYATDPSYAKKIKAIAEGDLMGDVLRGLKFGGLTPID